jgi:hypothetical protein
MRIRENLSGLVSNNGKATIIPNQQPQIGKVFGVITTKDTPTKELFEKYGGYEGAGTIFYLDYNSSKNVVKTNLNTCKVAVPLDSSYQNYPLIGEIVLLTDAPSPGSQLKDTTGKKYYIDTINLFNNNQQNSPLGDTLGTTFIETADIRKLVSFQGDRIFQGRKGNGLRLGSTVKFFSDINEWSKVGEDGDPITILANGYITKDKSSLSPNIEEINIEKSSLYLTSTQLLPLTPDRNDILNPLTNPISPSKYQLNSQIILNSDRITLNSKKDEVMIFAKTNIELNTNNIINLNAKERVHLNTSLILLGTKKDGTPPDEPILLGNKTKTLLTDLIKAISDLGNALTSVVAPPPGSPIMELNTAGVDLVNKLNSMQKQLKNITSTNNFTI